MSDKNLTIIDGNHRAAALRIFAEEKGYNFLPLEVFVGLSPQANLYRWCVDFEQLGEILVICERDFSENST